MVHVLQPTEAGVPRAVANLVADQMERGWNVAVISPKEGESLALTVGAGARHVEWSARRDPGLSSAWETNRLRRAISSLSPDVIHLHSSKAGLSGRLAVRGRIPTLFQPHGWSFLALTGVLRTAGQVWERYAARWTDVTVCVSSGERSVGIAAGLRGDLRVVPNGVDTQSFGPATWDRRKGARRRLGIDDGPTAVCVGRLHHPKGQDVLLRAWADVKADVPRANLYLIGDGPDEQRFRSIEARDAHFAGPSEDVRDWLAAADVVVVPSRWEGMSLAMLEAMASARSVVSTDVSGARETLLPDAGAVVAVGDEDALAAAIIQRLIDLDMAVAEGANGRSKVEKERDIRVTTAAIARIYEELLAN